MASANARGQLRHLLASGPAIVFNLAVDPEPHMTFVSGNVQAQLGFAPAAFIENRELFLRLVHPDDRQSLIDAVPRAIVEGSSSNDFRMRTAQNDERWLHGELHAVRQENGAVQITGWGIDVTESRRTAEAREQAREAAEAASRAKSDFLANMSHEIRTPMNGVLGMLELALDAEMPPEQREYLSVAHASAESLLSVINDVLDFSKIEAGKMELDCAEFRLVDALEDTLSGLALRAHNKGLELALHIQPEVPERIVGDIGRLRQVIINLVGNAIKFTERGEVVVRVGTVMTTRTEIALQFCVSDTGIGVPASKQGTIFEAFAQADTSMTRQYGGTGLGLAISTRLVRLMGGRIWVDSVPGTGSTFYFVAHFGIATNAAVDVRPADLSDVPVLVVDDNATNRTILSAMLTRWGMKPTVVDSGAAALALLQGEHTGRDHFKLLIADAQMPEMDGFALVAEVGRDATLGAPAIMMLSSAAFHDDVRRCRDAGIDVYLTKPVRAGELRASIARLLGENAPSASPTIVRFNNNETPATARTLRVLLAEDNAVNRRLALSLLERRHAEVTVAVDGREALAAWAPSRFDIVLMDIQMPELDGLEVTRAIRARESIGMHVPIVALTARAMSDDRDRCLDAGMDAYLTKPLRVAELNATIDRLTSPAVAKQVESVNPPAAIDVDAPHVFELARLRETTGNDDALAAELIALFRGDAPNYLARIREALDAHDPVALREAAHALKGAARTIAATEVAGIASMIETASLVRDLARAMGLVEQIATACNGLEVALEDVFAPAADAAD